VNLYFPVITLYTRQYNPLLQLPVKTFQDNTAKLVYYRQNGVASILINRLFHGVLFLRWLFHRHCHYHHHQQQQQHQHYFYCYFGYNVKRNVRGCDKQTQTCFNRHAWLECDSYNTLKALCTNVVHEFGSAEPRLSVITVRSYTPDSDETYYTVSDSISFDLLWICRTACCTTNSQQIQVMESDTYLKRIVILNSRFCQQCGGWETLLLRDVEFDCLSGVPCTQCVSLYDSVSQSPHSKTHPTTSFRPYCLYNVTFFFTFS